jgi:hypothetical protein
MECWSAGVMNFFHYCNTPILHHSKEAIIMYSAILINSGVGEFFIQSLSFPRKRESRNVLLKKLDARLRGHDGKNSPTAQLTK